MAMVFHVIVQSWNPRVVWPVDGQSFGQLWSSSQDHNHWTHITTSSSHWSSGKLSAAQIVYESYLSEHTSGVVLAADVESGPPMLYCSWYWACDREWRDRDIIVIDGINITLEVLMYFEARQLILTGLRSPFQSECGWWRLSSTPRCFKRAGWTWGRGYNNMYIMVRTAHHRARLVKLVNSLYTTLNGFHQINLFSCWRTTIESEHTKYSAT